MNKNLEIVMAIRNGDENRINFFVNKLVDDVKYLEKHGISISKVDLRNMFLNLVNNYDLNASKPFYFNILKEIKDMLKNQYNVKVISNKFFNEKEMTILSYYLKKFNGGYYSYEYISKEIGCSVIEIIQTVDKLKQLYRTNKPEIQEIFNDTTRLYLETSKNKIVPKAKVIPSITEEELEYLGLYTGQINNICLDPKEIAIKYKTNELLVIYKLKNIFELLKEKKNMDLVLKRYPYILPFLEIKYRSLYQLEKDKEKSNGRKRRYNIERNVKVFKLFYQKKEDGSYRSYKEIATLLNVSETSIATIKYNINKNFNEDDDFKEKILSFYPELERDIALYKHWRDNKKKYTQYEELAEEYAALFKLIYKKDSNGKYRTLKSVAEDLGLTESMVYRRNHDLFNMINSNQILCDLVLQKYPTLLSDKCDYDIKMTVREKRNEDSIESFDQRIEEYVEFLKCYYKRNQDGKYNSRKDIANLLYFNIDYITCKHRMILDTFENDEDIRQEILNRYPEFLEDRERYISVKTAYKNPKAMSDERKKTKAREYVDFLTKVFEKKQDGTYHTSKELQIILDIDINYLPKKRKTVLSSIDDDPIIKEYVLELYPTFLEDRNAYESCESNMPKIAKKGIVKIREDRNALEIIKFAMKKNPDGTYKSIREVCCEFNIKGNTIIKKFNYINKLLENNDEHMKSLIEKEYPEFLREKEEYSKHIGDSNAVINYDQFEKRTKNYVEFLKYLYHPKEDGTYYTHEEIAKLVGIKVGNVHDKKYQVFGAMEKNEVIHKLVLELYPELETDMEEYEKYVNTRKAEKQNIIVLSAMEEKISDELFCDVTRKIISIPALATKLNIKEASLNTLRANAKKKIRESEVLQKKYPTAEKEAVIFKNSSKYKSVLVSEDILTNIKMNVRTCDIPKAEISDDMSDILDGIRELSKSIYKDYVELCTYEQKAILALRLGFYNNTIFGSSDIAELFKISSEEVDLLTDECLRLCIPYYEKNKVKQKELIN